MIRSGGVVALTFLVAITPSVSDAEQLRRNWDGQGVHPWVWIGGWYLLLLLLLSSLWREAK